MKINFNQFYIFIFILGIFFFPFNSFEGLNFLGEFKKESGAYFFLIGFFALFYRNKIYIPLNSIIFRIILLLISWCFFTTILNSFSVSLNYLKHSSGFNRFIRQFFSLLLSSIIFFIFYYNVIKMMTMTEILFKIRKTFLFSLSLATIIGFFEALVGVFGIGAAKLAFIIFNFFPFFEKPYFKDRISSISYEPPFLAIYLITIFGWMLSYIITNKGNLKYIPSLMVLILTFFSGSRTALIVILVQLFLFIIFILPREKYLVFFKNIVIFLFVCFSFLLIFNGDKIVKSFEKKIESLNFKKNLKNNISNQSRFGLQYASLQVFFENPIFGVGFGQQSFTGQYHYPGWAIKKNYEFDLYYKNPAEPSFPPGYNIYTRILAETGLIGFSLFIFLMYSSIKMTYRNYKNSINDKKTLCLILIISFVGLFINWMQIDTFRIYGVWISLAILIKVNQEICLKNE